jgi:hypothetical protein
MCREGTQTNAAISVYLLTGSSIVCRQPLWSLLTFPLTIV